MISPFLNKRQQALISHMMMEQMTAMQGDSPFFIKPKRDLISHMMMEQMTEMQGDSDKSFLDQAQGRFDFTHDDGTNNSNARRP